MSGTPPPAIDGFSDLTPIGRGGFSTVYAGVQAGIERRVAIKVLDLGSSDVTRFERECRTLGSLSGVDGIVPVLQAAFTTTGQPSIVMQLMDGGSLAQRIRTDGPLDPADVVRHGVTLATALQRAHDAEIFHRDIKPENVLFHDGRAAIADFGIAQVAGVEQRSQTIDSISPPHAPPERFLDGTSDPVLGDIYSLGSTLYTALAGHPPHGTAAEGGLAGLITRVTGDPLPPIDRAEVPDRLWQVLDMAMAKDPAQRHRSMSDLAVALRSVTSGSGEPDERTVARPGSRTVPRQGPPPLAPPLPPVAPIPPAAPNAVNGPMPYAGSHTDGGQVHQPLGPVWTTGPVTVTGPGRTGSFTWLWATAIVMLALAVGGIAFLVARGAGEQAAPSVETSTTASTTSTTTTTMPTTSTVVDPFVDTPAPTAPPTTAIPVQATSVPVSEATTAVDQYIAAASGFDVDEFALRWAYPIESHYGKVGVEEAQLRDSAARYWAKFQDLEFSRTGPTSVASSDRGWETTTEYRAVLTNNDGSTQCMNQRLRLGFDHSWHVRTAAEDHLSDC